MRHKPLHVPLVDPSPRSSLMTPVIIVQDPKPEQHGEPAPASENDEAAKPDRHDMA